MLRHFVVCMFFGIAARAAIYQQLPTTRGADVDLRLMTFNIRRFGWEDALGRLWISRKERVVELLKDFGPDIIGIQEAFKVQIRYIAGKLGDYDWFGRGRQRDGHEDEHNPIFYNTKILELLDYGTFWLNENQKEGEQGWGAELNRICTWGKFIYKSSGVIFWVFNTHLTTSPDKAKEEGLKLIIQEANKRVRRGERIFLMGDLNVRSLTRPPLSLVLDQVEYTMFNTANLAEKKAGVTWTQYSEWKPTPHILDYILTKDLHTLIVEQWAIPARADGKIVSDHNPIVVDIQFI